MLGVVLIVTAVLIGVGIYSISNSEETPRGSQGPVMQSAPRSDPAPTFMQPGYRPDRSR
jgi:hypothetical protein